MFTMVASAFLLSSVCPAQVPERYIETYIMPLEDWTRIPAATRDDHGKLRQKCVEALDSGKIERIDRVGGSVPKGNFHFGPTGLFRYPATFVIEGNEIVGGEILSRDIGSKFAGGAKQLGESSSLNIIYARIPPHVATASMLGKGSKDDVKRTEVPIFEPIRLTTNVPSEFHGTHLIGVVPLPAIGIKPSKLALIFHSGGPEEQAITSSGGMVEMLLLRGTSGADLDNVSERIKALLGQRGSIEAAIALRSIPGSKGYLTGETEWVYPTSAVMKGEILVPQELEPLGQGTVFEMKCIAMDAKSMEIEFALSHDLAKPEIPVATGKGKILLTPDNVTLYRIFHSQKLTLISGAWTSVAEIPLAPILGAVEKSAKSQSCYLFARAISNAR